MKLSHEESDGTADGYRHWVSQSTLPFTRVCTVAKAGIHTTLNARCCVITTNNVVIAASNPVYGQVRVF